MSPLSKREVLERVRNRYKKASKTKKSLILDELCQITGFNRKYAIRKLSAKPKRRVNRRKKPGKKSQYHTPEILKPLRKLWHTSKMPCSKRLKEIIPIWTKAYQQEFGYLSFEVLQKLRKISPSTIDRILLPDRIKYRGKGYSTTRPGSLLKSQIPIQTSSWDEKRPGFLEADTVAHCGTSLAGDFVYTLDTVDIATSWTEQRAVWGKGQQGVVKQIKDIEHSLPFPLLGFDCDNGTEFLNKHLLNYFLNRPYNPVKFTRSRPYHKNDNAHIEQKNWTHVRQWLGYRRFDHPELIPLLNDLFKNEWRLFHNFFLPSTKIQQKQRVGSKIIRKHDVPKTPYQRILDSPLIPQKTKDSLKAQFNSLNPFHLDRIILKKIAVISKLASVTPNLRQRPS